MQVIENLNLLALVSGGLEDEDSADGSDGGGGGGGGGGITVSGSFADGANGVLDAAGRGAVVGGTIAAALGPEMIPVGAAAGTVIGAGVKILTSPGK